MDPGSGGLLRSKMVATKVSAPTRLTWRMSNAFCRPEWSWTLKFIPTTIFMRSRTSSLVMQRHTVKGIPSFWELRLREKWHDFIHFKIAVSEHLPLKGCLNPDANVYSVSFISQEGKREEVLDEQKSLRELNPFMNILKFTLRRKNQAQHSFKIHVGQLIGMDLKKFDRMMNCEVNDFRWRMKVFSNKIAQDRRARL